MKKLISTIAVITSSLIILGCNGQINEKPVQKDFENTDTIRRQELAQIALVGDYKVAETAVADTLMAFLVAKDSNNERAATVNDYSLTKIDSARIECSSNGDSTDRSSDVAEYDNVDFYLYQINNSVTKTTGYAVLSNDKRIGEIISIVDDCEFSEDISDNPFMQFFCTSLESYVEETAGIWNSLTDEDLNAARASYADMILSKNYSFEACEYDYKNSNITSILSTKWNKNSPYNEAVVNITKQNCHVGCGAVALAQIMAFHNYPRKCTTDIQNIIKNNWSTAVSWDGNYNWYSMKAAPYIWNISQKGQIMIEALMYQVAVGIKSRFAINGTDVTESFASNYGSFLNSIGYNCGSVQGYNFNVVKASIDNRCPLVAGGASIKKTTQKKFLWWKWNSNTYDIGHAWVIDGYCSIKTRITNKITNNVENTVFINYVHCNYGLGGSHDGFYIDKVFTMNANEVFSTEKIKDMARYTQEGVDNYFNYKLEIIPNIKPNY